RRYAFLAGCGLDAQQILRHSNSAPPALGLGVRHALPVGSWQLWLHQRSPALPRRVRYRVAIADLDRHQQQCARQDQSARIRQHWWPTQYVDDADQVGAAKYDLVQLPAWNLRVQGLPYHRGD